MGREVGKAEESGNAKIAVLMDHTGYDEYAGGETGG